jgi:hypothetical protein
LRLVLVLVAALVLAVGLAALVLSRRGGEGPGLNLVEAMNAVENRVREQRRPDGEIYAQEAFTATAPSGHEAWLVRASYTGGSTCMYVWYRDAKYHLEPDRGCSEFESLSFD